MRLLKALGLLAAALCLCSCDNPLLTGIDPSPSPSPSASPSPTPVPLAQGCEVDGVTIRLEIAGKNRFVIFLGEVAIFHANVRFAGESMSLEPPFDPSDCPEQKFFHWTKRGVAAPSCMEQGNEGVQDYRLVCDSGGDLRVEVFPAGFDNVRGAFNTEVKQSLAALTVAERIKWRLE